MATFPRLVPEVWATSDGKMHTSLEAAQQHEDTEVRMMAVRTVLADAGWVEIPTRQVVRLMASLQRNGWEYTGKKSN